MTIQSSGTTSSSLSASGGNVTLTATVTTTRFATQTVSWSKSGGTVSATTGNSVTFTAPANTSETAAVTYTITATCDGKTATYTVTVAKKAASVKYYWYTGQTQPTTDNYTTLDGIQQVTSYPTTVEYTNTSGKRGYTYIILHNSKTLTAVEKVSQATINFTTDTSIPNYTIYKSTVGIAVNGVIVITIK